MYNPQVEELEPRQLLNGTNSSLGHPPSRPFEADLPTDRSGGRAPVVDYGGRSPPVRQSRAEDSGSSEAPSRWFAPPCLEGRGADAPDRPAPGPRGPDGTCLGVRDIGAPRGRT